MPQRVFDTISRHAANAVSRRASLVTLGSALLAGSAPSSLLTAARNGKKARKRTRKTCKRQVASCRQTWQDRCATDIECEADNLERILACCEPLSGCKAGAALDCLFSDFS
jgi:hypothetical protein